MGVTPQYQGKYGQPWTINLNTDSAGANLTGIAASSISIVVRNVGSPASDVTSTGTIAIVSVANPAQITWQPTATDYAATGSFQMVLTVTLATGPVTYDPIPFVILAT